jgi:hypothetical protein
MNGDAHDIGTIPISTISSMRFMGENKLILERYLRVGSRTSGDPLFCPVLRVPERRKSEGDPGYLQHGQGHRIVLVYETAACLHRRGTYTTVVWRLGSIFYDRRCRRYWKTPGISSRTSKLDAPDGFARGFAGPAIQLIQKNPIHSSDAE